MPLVPLKEKLSAAYDRATGKESIYSHMFEQRGHSAGVTGYDDDTRINVKHYYWLKAVKIEGPDEKYKVLLCDRRVFAHEDWSNVSDQKSYSEKDLVMGSAYQVKRYIWNWEKDMLAQSRTTITKKQPFKAHIKKNLSA